MAVPSLSCLRTLHSMIRRQQPTTRLQQARLISSKPKPLPQKSTPSQSHPPTSPTETTWKEPDRETLVAGPRPLDRPLGVADAPHVGENWGVDPRSLRQRRDDFVNHDKHLERRTKLANKLFRPYFKDFNDMRFHKGKVFTAPERPIKAQFAGYFPNLHGRTLRDGIEDDTTSVLEDKVSVVTITSSGWAEKQVKGFVGETENPALTDLLDHDGRQIDDNGRAQLVEINYEPNAFKNWMVRMFESRLRAARNEFGWGRYFLVGKGFDHDLRLSIGVSNQKVGHVYLVDGRCKIRWAGHAEASQAERESLVSCLKRLLREAEGVLDASTAKTGAQHVRRDSAVDLETPSE